MRKIRLRYLILLVLLSGSIQNVNAQLSVDTTVRIRNLVNDYFLTGSVKAFNIKWKGNKKSIGLFRYDAGSFEIKKGIILSTGRAVDAIGPNDHPNVSGALYYTQPDPDPDLAPIANGKLLDPSVLEFDFIPESDSISFRYIFGSEEYPEYVGSAYNDVFAFFLSGPGIKGRKNLAVLPGTSIPVSINTINHKVNSEYFRNNYYYLNEKKWTIKTRYKAIKYRDLIANSLQYDGYTTVLFAKSKVTRNKKYHIKIIIADVADNIYDSGVFLQANSFISYTRDNDTLTNNNPEWKTISIPVKKDTILLTITMHINFDFDSTRIPDSSFSALNRICTLLKSQPGTRVEIYGHTDSVGSSEYNMDLSSRRAIAVLEYLASCGISKDRLTALGKGFNEPVANNSSSEGRALNRRVVFIIKKNKPED